MVRVSDSACDTEAVIEFLDLLIVIDHGALIDDVGVNRRVREPVRDTCDRVVVMLSLIDTSLEREILTLGRVLDCDVEVLLEIVTDGVAEAGRFELLTV